MATATRPLLDVLVTVNNQTGTSYTLQPSDNNKIVVLTNAAAITLICPSTLPLGFNCLVLQGGAGQVTVAAGAGAGVRNFSNHTKIAGQYATASLVVYANAGGSAAQYSFGGVTA